MDQTTNLVRGNVVIPLDLAILLNALQQDMGADHIVHGEFVRVAKAQVHVRVRSKVEDSVDVVLLQAFDHVGGDGHVAVEEVEVARLLRLQQARIVERAAIVEFVKADDVVKTLEELFLSNPWTKMITENTNGKILGSLIECL